MLAFLVFISSLFQVQDQSVPLPATQVQQVPVRDTLELRTLRVNRIIILGNKITRNRIILRELSLAPGDTISSARLDDQLVRDRAKIYNLRLFNTVIVRWLEYDPLTNSIDIIVEVTERWYTFPAPIFELTDRNFTDWWRNYNHDWRRVNYGLRLYQTNFRGANEKVRLTAQFGYKRKFLLTYSIPNIGKSQKHGLIFDMGYDEPWNLAYKTEDHVPVFIEAKSPQKREFNGSITYNYRRSFYEIHSFQVEYTRSRITDTIPMLNENYYKNGGQSQQLASIAYSFNSEHRDVIAYPMKGYNFGFFVAKTGLGFGMDINLVEANATFAKHVDLGKGFNFANFSSLYVSTPQNQPYAIYSALGYRRQFIRGYEAYLIEGPQFILNKTTFKKKIFSHAWKIDDIPLEQFNYIPIALYLKAYFDWGYVNNYTRYDELNINTRLTNQLLMGAGMGLDLVTLYDNVFRFEYTITKDGKHGFFFNIKKEF